MFFFRFRFNVAHKPSYIIWRWPDVAMCDQNVPACFQSSTVQLSFRWRPSDRESPYALGKLLGDGEDCVCDRFQLPRHVCSRTPSSEEGNELREYLYVLHLTCPTSTDQIVLIFQDTKFDWNINIICILCTFVLSTVPIFHMRSNRPDTPFGRPSHTLCSVSNRFVSWILDASP